MSLTFFILGLIELLGNPSFQTRQYAHHLLGQIGHPAIPFLEMVSDNPDLEIRRRAERIVGDWYGSFHPTGSLVIPWLDMLPDGFKDRGEIVSRYLSQIRDSGQASDFHPHWSEYRLATRNFIMDLYKCGMTREEIIKLLDQMRMKEKEYYKNREIPLPDDWL